MHLSINIVGDAFADVYCYLEGSMPEHGGDARLAQPMHTVPGGSGLNTATHLSSLLRHFWEGGSGDDSCTSNVNLQTVVNENDQWGKMLISHCNRHRFSLINRRVSNHPSCYLGTNESMQSSDGEKSTGHCAVIVSNDDRSFMTHLGCMEDFRGSHILTNFQDSDETRTAQHVHIAGYYNIAGFWDGALAYKLKEMHEVRAKSTKQRLTISLVPQHDATNKWDGGLMDLMQYIDFLVLNEVEAAKITRYHREVTTYSEDELLGHASRFFRSYQTRIVVTLGSNGAAVLHEGAVLHRQRTLPRTPADPTGAGDAFVAGFLLGYLSHTNSEAAGTISTNAVKAGLQWGCTVGTCSVMVRGASVPSDKASVERTLSSISELASIDRKRQRVAEG